MNLPIIEQLVAPVVLISACRLLGMAQYNRLANVGARIRSFHLERVELYMQLRDMKEKDLSLQRRFEGIHHQPRG